MRSFLRFLRRLLPRFGITSLLAAMLLAISVGGWWKFHRDLYLEELAILEELADAGCNVSVSREVPPEDPTKAVPGIPEEASFWSEHLLRIRVLSVAGDPSPELRTRLTAMPELEFLQIYAPPTPPSGVPPMPSARDVLGSAAPVLAEPRLDPASAAEPHPAGTALSAAETAALIEQVRNARTNPTLPDRAVRIAEEEAFDQLTVTLVHARDGEASLLFEDQKPQWTLNLGQLQIVDERESCILGRMKEGWTLISRTSSQMPVRAHHHPPSLDEYIAPRFALRPADLEHVAAAEGLEGNRIRLMFRPHVRDLFDKPGPTLSLEERSLILDGDLDWTPVSLREVHRTSMMAPNQPSIRIAQESRFERIGGYVLPVEAVGEKFRTRVAWTIDPTFEPGTFSMEKYFDEPVPARRDLPFWRWYRVGYAISAALFAFLIGRSVVGQFRGKAKRQQSADDAPSEANEGADEAPAAAATPGS